MRAFAEAYPDLQLCNRAAQLSGVENQEVKFCATSGCTNFMVAPCHYTLIRLRARSRMFYIQQTRENGWSKNVLSLQIENNLLHAGNSNY